MDSLSVVFVHCEVRLYVRDSDVLTGLLTQWQRFLCAEKNPTGKLAGTGVASLLLREREPWMCQWKTYVSFSLKTKKTKTNRKTHLQISKLNTVKRLNKNNVNKKKNPSTNINVSYLQLCTQRASSLLLEELPWSADAFTAHSVTTPLLVLERWIIHSTKRQTSHSVITNNLELHFKEFTCSWKL